MSTARDPIEPQPLAPDGGGPAAAQACVDPEPAQVGASGRFLVRLPKSLHARLAARARQEGVSLNTLVVAALAEAAARVEAPVAPKVGATACKTG